VNLAAPIAYLAMVLLVAFFIARRRLERRERAALVPPAPARDPDGTLVRRVEPRSEPIVVDDEENMPRWLRPSLRAERFGMDQTRARVLPSALRPAPPARTPLTFGGAPDDWSDRRAIRSAVVVGLLDQPDDAAGRRLADLEHGDEVEIMETDGQWANVLTPTGVAGWLPTAALAELTRRTAAAAEKTVIDDRLAVSPREDRGVATAADEPLDLVAYLAARRHTDTRTGSSGVG
jgi:hypothetical protein